MVLAAKRILGASMSPRGRLLAVLAVSLHCIFGLDPRYRITQYGHAAWTHQEGGVLGGITALAQTKDGKLWVGTEFGLFHFDGITFSPLRLAAGERLKSQAITALRHAQDGGVWIGTRSMVSHWNGTTLQWYPISNGARALPVGTICVDHKGNVWIGTVGFRSGGLAKIASSRVRYYGAEDGFRGVGVLAMYEDRSGNLWIGSQNGLFRWDGRTFHQYQSSGAPNVGSLAETSDGSLIAVSEGGSGLKRLVGDILKNYHVGEGVDHLKTRVVLADRNGALWIGTIGEGLIHVHQGLVERLTRQDGLSGSSVLSLFEDREGNIWVGTERGLDRFRDLPATTLSTHEGLSEDTAGSVFASMSGGTWIGTANGLNRVQGNQITHYDRRQGLPTDRIGSVFEDRRGNVWVGSPQGLAFGNNGRFPLLSG